MDKLQICKTISSKALNPQNGISVYGLPFTLNPATGCPFACKYCFSPLVLREKRADFYNKVEIKVNMPEILDRELEKLTILPQHLKRVQVNETNDIYHPLVLHGMQKKFKRDIMMEILEVFQKHWENGNHWMLHILTKSHLITEHIEKLKEMRHMVQAEISLSGMDEGLIRKTEMFTPSAKKRIKTIERLAAEGIFVRVMAMPCFEEKESGILDFRSVVLQAGAKAFKHKKLNYFSPEDVINISYEDLLLDKLPVTGRRKDEAFQGVLLKSGEHVLKNGKVDLASVLMPSGDGSNWTAKGMMNKRLTFQMQPVRNSGYRDINEINWNYLI